MSDIRWLWAMLDTEESRADRSWDFWSAVTRSRLSPRRGERGEFATLEPAAGDAWLKVQRVLEGDGVHLDLDVDDPIEDTAVDAVRLGARTTLQDSGFIALRSPGGLPFCVTSWTGAGLPMTQSRLGERDLAEQVCIDVPRELYAAELDFWEALTGWPRRASATASHPEFTSLVRPEGMPIRLLFQRLGEPTGQVRAHLDFACLDRAETVAAHRHAGAEVVAEHAFWTVMGDPLGRLYCLTDRPPDPSRT